MSFMDKVKGATKGKNAQLKAGVDKAQNVAKDRLSDKNDGKVDSVAAKARGAVDRLDPDDALRSHDDDDPMPPTLNVL